MASEQLAGLRTTGRRVAGVAADLVEVVSPQGHKQAALVFDPRHREHEALLAIERHLSFLADPGVDGVCRLVRHEPAEGAFLYDTRTCWSVAEVVRVFADQGEVAGIRAGLELCYLAGQVLVDAAEAGGARGPYAHGSLDPLRVLVGPDGRVTLLGYALPPVDLLEHLETQRRPAGEDTVRYAPPERFDGVPDDLSSDLYTLALVALELTMGRPVYDGLVDDIRQQAMRGDAVRRLYQWRERLPDAVREAYGRALKPDPDARFRDGVDFVYAFHDLLGSLDAEGPGLGEVMTRFRGLIRRGREFDGGATGALTQEELAALAADLEAEAPPLPPPRRPRPVEPEPDEPTDPGEARWQRVSRDRDDAPSARDRLRARIEGREEALSARDRLKARLRARSSGGGATGRPRRVRRDDDEPEASAPPPAPSPPAAPTPSPAPSPTPTPPAPSVGRLRLEVRAGGELRSIEVDREATVGEVAARVAATVAPVETDLLGGIVAWPVVEQGGRRIPGDRLADVLDGGGPITLLSVPNRVVRLAIEVRGSGAPVRFVAPVGTAVPARNLLLHLRRWLDLPDGPWTLRFGDRTVAPHQVLADFEPAEGQTLTVSR